MNAFIRLLYTLLIAAATVAFVGVGIFSFYQPPKAPEYPNDFPAYYLSPDDDGYKEQQTKLNKQQDDYNKLNDEHQNKMDVYYRNVAIAALPITVLLLAAGILLLNRLDAVGEGIALGGIATSVYTITVASMADQRVLRFLAVAVFLAGAIVLTERKFKPQKS